MDDVLKDIQGDVPWCVLFVVIDETRVTVNIKLELWR
jgi:hypothetical protein